MYYIQTNKENTRTKDRGIKEQTQNTPKDKEKAKESSKNKVKQE